MKKYLTSWGIFLLIGVIIYYPLYHFKIPLFVVFLLGIAMKFLSDYITNKIYKQ